MTPEQTLMLERLQRVSQEFLDRWYPGTGVTVDWTGDSYILQLARGLRPVSIWIDARGLQTLDDEIGLRRQLLVGAWRLAREAFTPVVQLPDRGTRRSSRG